MLTETKRCCNDQLNLPSEHRLPTVIASQSGPAYWVEALPDRVAADSIVNRLANHSRTINLGRVDMRKLRNDNARADKNHWEQPHPGGAGRDPQPAASTT
jgi:hypothetical protein